MASTLFVFKTIFKQGSNSDIRRFKYDPSKYLELRKRICEAYSCAEDVVVRYEDDEGDLVTIGTDEELVEAVDLAVVQNKTSIKLFVDLASDVANSVVEAKPDVEQARKATEPAPNPTNIYAQQGNAASQWIHPYGNAAAIGAGPQAWGAQIVNKQQPIYGQQQINSRGGYPQQQSNSFSYQHMPQHSNMYPQYSRGGNSYGHSDSSRDSRDKKDNRRGKGRGKDSRNNQGPNMLLPKARFIQDSSLPDRSLVAPGLVLKKSWDIENAGMAMWPFGTRLYQLRGNLPMVESDDGNVVPRVEPGKRSQVSVMVRVPDTPGRYTSYFRLGDMQKNFFGPRLWCDVVCSINGATDIESVQVAPKTRPEDRMKNNGMGPLPTDDDYDEKLAEQMRMPRKKKKKGSQYKDSSQRSSQSPASVAPSASPLKQGEGGAVTNTVNSPINVSSHDNSRAASFDASRLAHSDHQPGEHMSEQPGSDSQSRSAEGEPPSSPSGLGSLGLGGIGGLSGLSMGFGGLSLGGGEAGGASGFSEGSIEGKQALVEWLAKGVSSVSGVAEDDDPRN